MQALKNTHERSGGWFRLTPSPDALGDFLSSRLYASKGHAPASTGAGPRRLMLQLHTQGGEAGARMAWLSLSSRLSSPLGAAGSEDWYTLLSAGTRQLRQLLGAELELCRAEGAADPGLCSPEHTQRVERAARDLEEVARFASAEARAFQDEPQRLMPQPREQALRRLVDGAFRPLSRMNELTSYTSHAASLPNAGTALAVKRMAWWSALQAAFPGDITLQNQGLFCYDVYRDLRHRRLLLKEAQERLLAESQSDRMPHPEEAMSRQVDLEECQAQLDRLRILLRVYRFLLDEALAAADRPAPAL